MDKKIFSEFKKIGPWLVVPSIYHFRFREETPLIDYFLALTILFLVIYYKDVTCCIAINTLSVY